MDRLYIRHAVLGLLLFNGVYSLPSRTEPLDKRQSPQPSSYPLGDPYPNEWKYVNFDPKTDQSQLQAIHNAFPEMLHLALAAISSAESATTGSFVASYSRFYDVSENGEEEASDEVLPPLRAIVPAQQSDPSDIGAGPALAQVIIDATDFFAGNENEESCSVPNTLAYTNAADNRIHFCNPLAFELPIKSISDLSCTSLTDNYVSDSVDSLARLELHELLHCHAITGSGISIVDSDNEDGGRAYGPERAHALVKENPGLCTVNADNYVWMAMNTYFANMGCSNIQDPPAYEPGNTEDNE